ncbi:MAG TPA: hypothetical protein VLA66_02385, partial [Thermoanaerobaculia bacterium]|nr:hypothetical protein [Thermoanaerobaculia bacterium]
RRGPAGGLFAVGAAAGFGAAIAGGGWPWAPLELWFDPALWGWNALFVLAGRSLGLLPFFLPAWIALARPATDEGRRWIPWSALGALVLLLATAPFDLAGDAGAPLLATFLPLYALMLLLPAGDFDRRALLAALVALPVLAPVWLDAAGAGERPWARQLDLVRHVLPLETTQRQVAGLSTLDRSSGVVLRGVAPAVRGGSRGRLELVEARATLIVESAVPLSTVRLELGAGAPASFEVEGGELGDVLYRPSGDVAVDVRLGSATRRHPTWRSPAGAAVAVFDLVLPEPPAAPIPFDLSQARPEGIGGEEP